MTRTLFILPSAIGDVIAGRGVAARLAEEGPVTWVVNALAAPALVDTPHRLLHPPSTRIRRMHELGAPIESSRRAASSFLEDIANSGPHDRVVQVHLSRAAAIMAGAARPGDRGLIRLGPALADPAHVPGGLSSDPWSDFFAGSIHAGFPPEMPAAARFSLIAGLERTALPREHAPYADRQEREGPFLVCPGAGWPSKRIPAALAAAIADRLGDLGDVELLGGESDRELLEHIQDLQRARKAALRVGPLGGALDAVRGARAIVTADSWPLHAAEAAGRPVLALLHRTLVVPAGARAAAFGPAEWPDWNAEGREVLHEGDADLAVALLIALAGGDAAGCSTFPGPRRIWRRPGLHPIPDSPIPAHRTADARLLLSWIRAKGFARALERIRPDLPPIPLRAAGDFAKLLVEPGDAVSEAERSFRHGGPGSFLDSFFLFGSTVPGHDPDAFIRTWIDFAREELEGLGNRYGMESGSS